MKFRNALGYALFGVVVFLALINTFEATEYVSNIAKAAIFPLFLIGIIDFLYKIKDKAVQIINENIDRYHANYREAKAIYNDMLSLSKILRADDEPVEEDEKMTSWHEEMQRNEEKCLHYHMLYIYISKIFNGCFVIYTIGIFILVISMLLAQSENWLMLLSKINSDTVTLWTFALLLLDVSFTDFFAKHIIKFAENKIEKD